MEKRIFIIEDDINLLSSLQAKFSVEGFNVSANNGAGELNSIIKLLLVFKPDLIVLDIILPKIDGFEILTSIKNDANLSKIPVFIFSNLSDDDTKEKCVRLGAEQYFIKSDFNIDQFVEKITKILINKEKILP
jgi:DNA-binding response OmpR family regulator